ncbi:MAG: ComEC family competence protein [Opitutales bacterium]|nr:ComEC family competence protein [Opitutales bacterium]NRA25897.1 ComEC/Rec2 family competence protein [Opitutales bacterium]
MMRREQNNPPCNPRAPILSVLLVSVVGILLADAFDTENWHAVGLSLSLIGAVISQILGMKRMAWACFLILLGFSAMWRTDWVREQRALQMPFTPVEFSATGTVIKRYGGIGPLTRRSYSVKIEDVRFKTDSAWNHKRVHLRSDSEEILRIGDRVSGRFYLMRDTYDLEKSGFQDYLRNQYVAATGAITEIYRTDASEGLDRHFRIFNQRWSALWWNLKNIHADTRAILIAISTGDRFYMSGDIEEAFIRTGTLHLFAVSGLHVFAVLGGIMLLCRIIRLPLKYRAWPICLGVSAYVIFVGYTPSALRALSLILLYYFCRAVHRRARGLPLLALSATIFIWMTPKIIYSLGFLLSYSVVGAIMLYAPILRDSFMPIVRRSETNTRSADVLFYRYSIKEPAIQCVLVSIAAFFGSAPWLAASQGLIAPWSIPANLIMVLLGTALLFSTLIGGLLAYAIPGLTEFWIYPAHFLAGFTRNLVLSWDTLPISIVTAPRESLSWPAAVVCFGLGYAYYSRSIKGNSSIRTFTIAVIPASIFMLASAF